MSSFKPIPRRIFIAGGLSACGLEPALVGQTSAQLRGRVRYPQVSDQADFWLNRELKKYFGISGEVDYSLDFQYSSSVASLAITQSNVITRYRMTATGRFIAKTLNDDQEILNYPFKRVASFSANESRYASDQARESTEEKLIVSLAQEFATRFRNAVADIETK